MKRTYTVTDDDDARRIISEFLGIDLATLFEHEPAENDETEIVPKEEPQNEEAQEETEDYLQKGERLLSLERETKSLNRYTQRFMKVSDVIVKWFTGEVSGLLLHSIAKKMTAATELIDEREDGMDHVRQSFMLDAQYIPYTGEHLEELKLNTYTKSSKFFFKAGDETTLYVGGLPALTLRYALYHKRARVLTIRSLEYDLAEEFIYSALKRYGEPLSDDRFSPNALIDMMFSHENDFFREYYRAVQAENERTEQSEHAASYETKRNIPQVMIKHMEESILNNHFGYIEYDHKCDRDKATEVELEIDQFIRNYFPKVNLKDVSLRFRYIGQHKASGLYYPSFKCICVSVISPSSFVHELGHCIDHLYDDLSQGSDFKDIYNTYRSLLESSEEGKAAKKSKTKYNLAYFLMPTECFARCMEMYFAEKITASICKLNDFSFAYPADETFRVKVRNYFDTLIIKLKGGRDNNERECNETHEKVACR